MHSVLSRVAELEHKFLKYAPKQNQERIKKVLGIFKDRANVTFHAVRKLTVALYSPPQPGRATVGNKQQYFPTNSLNKERHCLLNQRKACTSSESQKCCRVRGAEEMRRSRGVGMMEGVHASVGSEAMSCTGIARWKGASMGASRSFTTRGLGIWGTSCLNIASKALRAWSCWQIIGERGK